MSRTNTVRLWRGIAVVLMVLSSAGAAPGKVIYVDTDAPGADNGTSWADAYNFLQDALTDANSLPKPVEVRVAKGTYTPDSNSAAPDGTGDPDAAFNMIDDVTIKGGYAGNGHADPNENNVEVYETVLSGDLNGDDAPGFANYDENSVSVVTSRGAEPGAVLDGFVIKGAKQRDRYNGAGAIDIDSGSPTINNCRIEENYCAGVRNDMGSPSLTACSFIDNFADKSPGGLKNYEGTVMLTDCTFIGNEGKAGGIDSVRGVLTLINCVFSGNIGNSAGAVDTSGSLTMINCVVSGNSGSSVGAVDLGSADAALINCTVVANSATARSDRASGGLFASGGTLTIANCIFWGNYDEQPDPGELDEIKVGGLLSIGHSCVEGWTGSFGGVGNIGADPMFADAAGPDGVSGTIDDDLRLAPGNSLCIDAGNNAALPASVLTDLAGNERRYDDREITDTGAGAAPIVDMGAYEAVAPPEPELAAWPSSLTFKAIEGYVDPANQTLNVHNRGQGTLEWAMSESVSWLRAAPDAGTSAGDVDIVTVSVETEGLAAGEYEGVITFSSDGIAGSPQEVSVVLRVVPPWKNEIEFRDENFRVDGVAANDPGWVKFTIKLDDPNTVYYQDCQEYLYHYAWATVWLEPFVGMSPAEYEEVTLYMAAQEAVLGAVILPSQPGIYEYGIQFIRQEPYTRNEIAAMFNAVKASVICSPSVKAFYFPSYEQIEVARDNRDWFEAQGIPIGSTARWAEGNVCYSAGWALGELKYFSADQIDAAYASQQLLPKDILLTDAVPSEVPFVAGILTLSPSVPNSHVAILARTFGVPFAHLAVAEDAEDAQSLVGRTILLSAGEDEGVGSVEMKDVTDLLTPEEQAEILSIKQPILDISPAAPYGQYSADTNGLAPDDIDHFGGKAANYGILRLAIPENCPPAAAISFDLWNEFLDQDIATGNTLREEIDARLAGYAYPVQNMPALVGELEYIREGLFKNAIATSFSVEQQNAIMGILQDPRYGFDPNEKIRFRSSTNVEDSDQFSGAGLYDSYSGCLADDIDGDSSGPCICDPDKSKERGVFRAIRKVFASFYNDNAFLQRLRYDVNEADVGMGLLVHHSFPDEIELANGVATLERRADDSSSYIRLVTQEGAVSVANPKDSSIPEEVSVLYRSEQEIELTHVRSSNLVILGETVLAWPDDYNDLSKLLVRAADEFGPVPGKAVYTLDFEYKKLAPGGATLPDGGLVVKQIRLIPELDEAINTTSPFLLGEEATYYTLQGEFSDLFANHRLKSVWRVKTKKMWLTPENLERESLYADAQIEYAADGQVRTLAKELSLLPYAYHSLVERNLFDPWSVDRLLDGWSMHHLQNVRSYRLLTPKPNIEVGDGEIPFVSVSDFGDLTVEVDYSRPVPPDSRMTDTICIGPPPTRGGLVERSYSDSDISITTIFYYGWDGNMKTSPLHSFVETEITGLTTVPIVLVGDYSQTFHPQHHNFGEEFLFEPQLEPGISQTILDELRAMDVRMIYLYATRSSGSSRMSTYGFDSAPFCVGDVDGDCDVDFGDFSTVGAWWGGRVCHECGGADFDGDGDVTGKDLQQLGLNWLQGK